MKKIVALLLAMLFVISLFVGCGSFTEATTSSAVALEATDAASEPDEEVAPSSEASTAEEPAADSEEASVPEIPAYFPLKENKELTVWYMTIPMYGTLAEGPEDFPYLQEAQTRLNITLNFDVAPYTSAGENFSLMVASGDYDDLICMFSRFYTGTLDEAIDNDVVYDLTDVIEEWAPNYNAARCEDLSIKKQSETTEGRIALISPITTVDGQTAAGGPMIRNDWLKDLNFESPVTVDDYTEVLTTMNNEYGGTFALPSSGITSFNYINDAFDIKLPGGTTGEAWYQVDGVVKWGGYEEGYRDYLELMHSWYGSGLISSDFTSDTDSASSQVTSNDFIGTGSLAIFFGRTTDLSVYDGLISGENSVAAISDMRLTEDQTTHFKAAKLKLGSGWAVSTDCKDAELATRFLDWWWTDEGKTLANYGIEDETYTVDADGSFSFTDIVLNDPENPVTTTMTVYTVDAGNVPTLIDSSRNYQVNDERTMDANALWIENDDGSYLIDVTVATMLTTDEYEEFSATFSDISTIFSENCLKFITGDRSLDEFDIYLTQLEAAGIDRCIALVQTGYDRYMSE